MARSAQIGFFLAWLLSGCAQPNPSVVAKQYPSAEARDLETERAMKQLKEAALAINYESEMRLYLSVPPDFANHLAVRLSELERAVGQCTSNRTMVVVTMGPPMRMLPQSEFDAKVDEIEMMLTKVGFRRVVFHLGSAFGRPIYRE
jgi:hypothetical protein